MQSLSYSIKELNNCRLVKFEDIFESHNRVKNLISTVKYLQRLKAEPSMVENLEKTTTEFLQKKVNKSYYSILPKWNEWNNRQAKTLDKYCGKLMKNLGYGHETEWKKLINN